MAEEEEGEVKKEVKPPEPVYYKVFLNGLIYFDLFLNKFDLCF